jgi:protein-tyrosine phosphatase
LAYSKYQKCTEKAARNLLVTGGKDYFECYKARNFQLKRRSLSSTRVKSMNVLFVCSKNKWRSRTLRQYLKTPQPTSKVSWNRRWSQVKLNEKHLIWADIIFVMENKHRQIIGRSFKKIFNAEQKLLFLDIPDEYQFMDEELILLLKTALRHT